MDIDNVRSHFPMLKRNINGKEIIYFDNAATTLKPQSVIDAVVDYYSNHCANIHRGVHLLSEEASNLYDEARFQIAKFINAKNDEIIFTKGATEAINLVSHCLKIEGGDNAITSILEHHSNILPWFSKANLKILSIDHTTRVDLDDLRKNINSSTIIVATTHISNVTGVINHIEEIIKIAHQNGSLVLIDASQSSPHLKLDVKKMDCDFLVFSAHKMLGPTGIGVLYAKKEILQKIDPPFTGGGMVKSVDLQGFVPEDLPSRFEAGTPHIAGAIGFGAAVNYLEKIGMESVCAYEKELSSFLIESLSELEEIEIYPKPVENVDRIGTVSFRIKGMNPDDVASILSNRFNIMARTGVHCAEPLIRSFGLDGVVRVSTYIYNTKEEITLLKDALKQIISSFA